MRHPPDGSPAHLTTTVVPRRWTCQCRRRPLERAPLYYTCLLPHSLSRTLGFSLPRAPQACGLPFNLGLLKECAPEGAEAHARPLREAPGGANAASGVVVRVSGSKREREGHAVEDKPCETLAGQKRHRVADASPEESARGGRGKTRSPIDAGLLGLLEERETGPVLRVRSSAGGAPTRPQHAMCRQGRQAGESLQIVGGRNKERPSKPPAHPQSGPSGRKGPGGVLTPRCVIQL
jgi:hypothetical protein